MTIDVLGAGLTTGSLQPNGDRSRAAGRRLPAVFTTLRGISRAHSRNSVAEAQDYPPTCDVTSYRLYHPEM